MHHPVDTEPDLAYTSREAMPMLHVSAVPPARHRAALPRQIRPGEGENENLKPKPFRIGKVIVRPTGRDSWQIRYRDPQSGRDVRRRFNAMSAHQVGAIAGTINHELLAKGGYLPTAKPTLPPVAECLAEAISLRVQTASTRKDRIWRAMKFVAWLGEKHPKIRSWADLRPSTLQEYALDLQSQGKAWDSIRLALEPVRLTWRYMHENHSDIVRAAPRIKLERPPHREIEILTPGEVAALLDWAREHDPTAWPIFALAGLAGCRLQEITALRRQDINLAEGTITITKTQHHKPKTLGSWRTIPLASEPLAALRRALEDQKVVPATGEVFLNRWGNLWFADVLSARLARSLDRAAAATNLPRIAELPPRKLRAFYATTASRLGASDRVLRRILGHSPVSILDGHYRQVNLDEMRSVSSLMDGWRTALVKEKAGNSLAIADGDHAKAL